MIPILTHDDAWRLASSPRVTHHYFCEHIGSIACRSKRPRLCAVSPAARARRRHSSWPNQHVETHRNSAKHVKVARNETRQGRPYNIILEKSRSLYGALTGSTSFSEASDFVENPGGSSFQHPVPILSTVLKCSEARSGSSRKPTLKNKD